MKKHMPVEENVSIFVICAMYIFSTQDEFIFVDRFLILSLYLDSRQ